MPEGSAATDDAGSSRKRGVSKNEEDALTILKAVINFKAKNGSDPTPNTLGPVHSSLEGRLHKALTIEALYTKFLALRKKYYRPVRPGVTSPFEKTFFDLSVKAWGERAYFDISGKVWGEESDESEDGDEDEVDEDEDEDEKFEAICSEFKCLTSNIKKYWEEEGLPMSHLKQGLIKMDKSKAAALEIEWRKYDIESMDVDRMILDAKAQILKAFAAALGSRR